MITIRIEGTPAEIEAATAAIYKAFYVLEASENRKNRPPSDLVRRYLKVKSVTNDKRAHTLEGKGKCTTSDKSRRICANLTPP